MPAAEKLKGELALNDDTPRIGLLIVDVQKGFINEATQHIPGMVEYLQDCYRHVAATRFFNPDGSPFRRWLDWHQMDGASEDCELAFALRPAALSIDKPTYSCVDPRFLGWLNERQIDTVDICGLDTDACVLKCALDLFENGIRPVILKDYCASSAGARAHENALALLQRNLGRDQVAVAPF